MLGADILKLLQGELKPNRPDVGKIDKVRFYVCPACGNILTSTGEAAISCCGRKLHSLLPASHPAGHEVSVEVLDAEYYITLEHNMRNDHYISFAAYVQNGRLFFYRLYPEQSPAFRLPMMRRGGNLYFYCTKHGLQKYPFVPQMVSTDKKPPLLSLGEVRKGGR